MRVANLNPGRDVRATQAALVALGVAVTAGEDGGVLIRGGGLREPNEALACANSGSTARMLLGACAGADAAARFDGDASLRRRPMEPVAAQLRAFGARIRTTGGCLPLELAGTPEIQTRHFILLTPSAQVKSALLFAGLFGGVAVTVDGDQGSRDHTERLLRYLGADVEWNGRSVRLGASPLQARPLAVPGDFSAAAFFITAAAIVPGSSAVVCGVGVNPTRVGLLDVLVRMGAVVEVRNERTACGEPVADVSVEHRPLHGAHVDAATALRAIDEIPLLAIAAAFAQGASRIDGVAELRTKESDRIAAIIELLGAAGVAAEASGSSLTIHGGTPQRPANAIRTHGDHRIAMAAAVLGRAIGPVDIDDADCIDVSFPAFLPALERLRD